MGRLKTVQASTGTSAGTVTGIDGTTTAKSADYTVTDTDRIRTVMMTTGGSNRTVTLPTAADNAARIITVIKADAGAGNCVIDGEGSETIDGAAALTLRNQYGGATLQCDGTAWFVLSRHREIATASSTAHVNQAPVMGTAYAITSVSVDLTVGPWLIYCHANVGADWTSGAGSSAYTSLILKEGSNIIQVGVGSYLGDNAAGLFLARYGVSSISFVASVNLTSALTYSLHMAVTTISGSPVFGAVRARGDLGASYITAVRP